MKRLFKFLVCLSAVAGCAKEEIVESSGVAGITEITVSLPQTMVRLPEFQQAASDEVLVTDAE